MWVGEERTGIGRGRRARGWSFLRPGTDPPVSLKIFATPADTSAGMVETSVEASMLNDLLAFSPYSIQYSGGVTSSSITNEQRVYVGAALVRCARRWDLYCGAGINKPYATSC